MVIEYFVFPCIISTMHVTMWKKPRARENVRARTFFGSCAHVHAPMLLKFFVVVRYMVYEYFFFPWPISKIRFSMRKRPRAHVFGSRAHAHAPMWLNFFLWLDIWLMSILSFHDQSLECILLWVNGLYLKIHILTLSPP